MKMLGAYQPPLLGPALLRGCCAPFSTTRSSDLLEMLYAVVVSECLLSGEHLVEIEIQT